MQSNFTRKKIGRFFFFKFLILLFCFVSNLIQAQTYVNGVLSSGATANNGTAAPSGFTWSECQNVTGNTTVANQTAGSSAGVGSAFSVADDFTVPAGAPWNLTKITVYAYSTGFSGSTSPFNDVRIRIHSSSPMAGPTTIVFGDLTTNRLTSSSSADVYRIFNTLVPPTATGTTRRIWKLEATIAVTLDPGTYWLEYQTGTTLTSNFTPLSAPPGVRTLPGYNAIQRNNTTWTAITDVGITQAGTAANLPVALDLPFQIDYNTGACTGTPDPGNTISSQSAVCPATSFALSLQNTTPGSGVTYQWQSSPDGTTWTNIAGATGPTYSTTIAATTQYRAQVTCSGNTGNSNPVTVTLNPPSACYCIPAASNCTANDVILNVTVGGIDNTTTCSAGPPAGYSNYTVSEDTVTIIAGAANPMSVRVGPGGTENVGVWIDYDKSGSFEASEFTLLGSGNGVTINGSIPVPSTAQLGYTRMRVRVRFSTAVTGAQACTTFSFGETEDYTVNIVPCVPAVFTGQPASTSIQCGSNATFSVSASGSFPVYQWQQRPNSSSVWTNVTNGGVYAGATSTTLTLSNVPGSMSGYQFRALMTGGCSGTDFSNTATLTVTPLIATVTPANATICTGSIQQLTLTNLTSLPTYSAPSGLPLTVTDNSPAGVGSTINVSGIPVGAVVTDISVQFSMTHTYVGDVDINLIAPNGANLNLIGGLDNGTGTNATDHFVNTVISSNGTTALSGAPAPRTGTFAADARPGYGPTGNTQTVTTWAALMSQLNGNWRLVLADFAGGDVGVLSSWSITISYASSPLGVWTASPAAPNTMFTDAAATVAYVPGTPVTSIYVKPTASTSYSVVYTNSTPCTSNPTVIPVTVANPVTGLAVTPATSSACLGGSKTFTAATTGGNPLTYQWQDSTAAHTWQNISGATASSYTISNVTAARTGKYRVIATAAPCVGSVTSAPVEFTVNPTPTVTLASPNLLITPGQTTTITATSTPAAAGYSWTLNGAVIPNANGATVTATIDGLGSYHATVTDVNGCVGTSSTAVVIGGAESDNLWIYPNPTNGQFQVRLFSTGNPTEVRVVSIFTPSGQLLERKKFTLDNINGPYLRMDFDLSKFSTGTYIVKVEDRFSKVIASGFVVKQ